jgi:hypothetical protein
MVFSFWKTKACVSHLLISDETFMTLDKNLMGFFKCEHTKRLCDFAQMSISVKADELSTFEASLDKLLC